VPPYVLHGPKIAIQLNSLPAADLKVRSLP
jgi:hypothetical protein